MDSISLTDPLVRVFEFNHGINDWKIIGETEVIDDNLNPDFVKTIKLPFYFEKTQKIKFEVWDKDSEIDFEFVGSVETTVGIIMGSKAQTFNTEILDKKRAVVGMIIVRADSVSYSNEFLAL